MVGDMLTVGACGHIVRASSFVVVGVVLVVVVVVAVVVVAVVS